MTAALEFADLSVSFPGSSGRLQVLEVNSNPAWAALQRVNAVNIAQALADHLLARLATAARPLVGA